ncbi:isocitrate lyase/phosphoenolpyruvate mutase family protein [uncultured Tateyamaria sp.]|uniref:isocitrate lyase/phosphoenolpyruvate mutase family protein n=1 Tax=uncultured Tateyamaria sp. TaxID=455651 RepID=UPI00261CDB72|nr:isocitrate lyase/phosphoenolpyruvate mutase family protein [uncultured Tateyamaria sp.]
MDFRACHVPGDPLIMPNPWDVGSARILQNMGAKALATTNMGAAFARGKRDGSLSLDEMLDAATDIDDATDIPVSADLENCGADDPGAAAQALPAHRLPRHHGQLCRHRGAAGLARYSAACASAAVAASNSAAFFSTSSTM